MLLFPSHFRKLQSLTSPLEKSAMRPFVGPYLGNGTQGDPDPPDPNLTAVHVGEV